MPTTPEDADALFDLSAPMPPAPSAAPAAGASKASTPPGPGGVPAPAPGTGGLPALGHDHRKEQRVKVSWPARLQLPNGRVVEVRVRDLSDSGVGILTPISIPAGTTMTFALGVPSLADPSKITALTGTLRATYCVLQGNDIHCGGTWVQLGPDARETIDKWIRKLRK